MEITGNRIASALDSWKEKEERFKKMFDFDLDTNPGFQKEKYNFIESLFYRYGKTLNEEEMLALKSLEIRRTELDQKLYVAPLERLWRWLNQPIRITRYVRNEQLEQIKLAEFQAEVYKTVHNSGFSEDQLRHLGAAIKQADQIKKEPNLPNAPRRILIPVPPTHHRENINHEIAMDKDINGKYHYAGFYSNLTDESAGSVTDRQFFAYNSGISQEQARNIMQGRPVLISGGDDMTATYVQLDLKSNKVNGSHSLEKIEVQPDFNPGDFLKPLPISRDIHPNDLEIIAKLNKGERTPAMLTIDGRLKKVLLVLNVKENSIDMIGSDNKNFELTKEAEKPSEAQKEEHQQAKVVEMAGRKKGNGIS